MTEKLIERIAETFKLTRKTPPGYPPSADLHMIVDGGGRINVQAACDAIASAWLEDVEKARYATVRGAELQARANTYAEVADLVKDWPPLYKQLWDRRQETLKEMSALTETQTNE